MPADLRNGIFPVSRKCGLGVIPRRLHTACTFPLTVCQDVPDLPDLCAALSVVRPQVVIVHRIERQFNDCYLVEGKGYVVILPCPFNRRRGIGRVYGGLVLVVG